MSWKCDICDTYNDDDNMECYVCGTLRSEESIRLAEALKAEALRKEEERKATAAKAEAERLARERAATEALRKKAKLEKVNRAAGGIVDFVPKLVPWCGLIAGILVAANLTVKSVDGRLYEVGYAFKEIVENSWLYLRILKMNVSEVFVSIKSSFLYFFGAQGTLMILLRRLISNLNSIK